MKTRLTLLLNVIIFLLVGALVAAYGLKWYFEREAGVDQAVIIEVPKGAGLTRVADILTEKGLIDQPAFFKAAAYYTDAASGLKFGEYEIPAHASMKQILDILTEGKAIQLQVTFPEGWTSYAMVERLNAVAELTGEITDIPAEGSLAPNTYSFLRGADRQTVLDQMVAAQADNVAQAWENRAEDVAVESPEELLILASIIERETGNAEERPIVASVFSNRLRVGMKLQTDPTVIYGLTLGKGGLGRGIRKSELARETPYNTYVIEGLPPTPIANPGLASIQAAANPADTDFVFFVAATLDPSDGHLFARTLDEHNANVAKYRALEAAQ